MTAAKIGKAWALAALCAAAAFIVLVAGAGAAQERVASPPAVGPVVAVVDMTGVLRGSRQWRDSVDERARMLDRVKRTLDKLSRQVQILRNDYENLPPGTDERAQKGFQLEAALQELEQTRANLEAEVARHQNESVRGFFQRLTGAVADYAKENGIHLVLKKQALDLAGPDSVEQSLQIATAEVLYADASLDITDAIVARLNAAYPAPIEAK